MHWKPKTLDSDGSSGGRHSNQQKGRQGSKLEFSSAHLISGLPAVRGVHSGRGSSPLRRSWDALEAPPEGRDLNSRILFFVFSNFRKSMGRVKCNTSRKGFISAYRLQATIEERQGWNSRQELGSQDWNRIHRATPLTGSLAPACSSIFLIYPRTTHPAGPSYIS